MTTHLVRCSILVGKAATDPNREMDELGASHGSASTHSSKYRCKSCGQEYNSSEMGSDDLRSISCSNCYSDNVLLIEIEIGVPSAEECGTNG